MISFGGDGVYHDGVGTYFDWMRLMGAPGVWGYLNIVYEVVVLCLSFGMGWDLLFVAEDGWGYLDGWAL